MDKFSRQISQSTTVIDKLHTLSCVVDNRFPQGIGIVDKLLKTIAYQGKV